MGECGQFGKEVWVLHLRTSGEEPFYAKLAGQVVLHPNSLWSRLVKAKYKFTGSWAEHFKPKTGGKLPIVV